MSPRNSVSRWPKERLPSAAASESLRTPPAPKSFGVVVHRLRFTTWYSFTARRPARRTAQLELIPFRGLPDPTATLETASRFLRPCDDACNRPPNSTAPIRFAQSTIPHDRSSATTVPGASPLSHLSKKAEWPRCGLLKKYRGIFPAQSHRIVRLCC